MRNRLSVLGAACALVLLVLASAGMVMAGEEHAGAETTLTGLLNSTEDGGYVLIEQASGESIALTGSASLADHVGSNVTVTGTWAEDAAGAKTFEVATVEAAAAEPEA